MRSCFWIDRRRYSRLHTIVPVQYSPKTRTDVQLGKPSFPDCMLAKRDRFAPWKQETPGRFQQGGLTWNVNTDNRMPTTPAAYMQARIAIRREGVSSTGDRYLVATCLWKSAAWRCNTENQSQMYSSTAPPVGISRETQPCGDLCQTHRFFPVVFQPSLMTVPYRRQANNLENESFLLVKDTLLVQISLERHRYR